VQQALSIAEEVLPGRPVRLLSSPLARCVDTLRPLAVQSGLPILKTESLGPSAEISDVMDLLTKQPGRSVLCTHGEMMEPLLSIFSGVGMRLSGAFAPEGWLRKGVVWQIDREAMSMECLTPSSLTDCDRHPEYAIAP